MFAFVPNISMSEAEFYQLKDFIYQYCGLFFGDDTKYLFEQKLNKRLKQLRLSSFRDYYYVLRYGQDKVAELASVIDLLTTNETYFFREPCQLRALTDEIIPELCAQKEQQGDRRLRIWSAGCSSGEEPYTIAMLLLESPRLIGWQLEVIGTDICQQVLQAARRGVYGPNSFRVTDRYYRQKYFKPSIKGEERWQIADRVKSLVSISHLNLIDPRHIALLGPVDLVLCRNVIIYFDLESKRRAIGHLSRQLADGGYLLLGHSESLINVSTDFKLCHLRHDMVYQRPQGGRK